MKRAGLVLVVIGTYLMLVSFLTAWSACDAAGQTVYPDLMRFAVLLGIAGPLTVLGGAVVIQDANLHG